MVNPRLYTQTFTFDDSNPPTSVVLDEDKNVLSFDILTVTRIGNEVTVVVAIIYDNDTIDQRTLSAQFFDVGQDIAEKTDFVITEPDVVENAKVISYDNNNQDSKGAFRRVVLFTLANQGIIVSNLLTTTNLTINPASPLSNVALNNSDTLIFTSDLISTKEQATPSATNAGTKFATLLQVY